MSKKVFLPPKLGQLAGLICFFYSLSFSLINWARFRQFQSFYYDLGIFARTVWQFFRFQAPTIDHYTFGLINELADHFNPGLVLLAPVFWLTKQSVILPIIQSLSIGLTGWFLYLSSRNLTKNNFFSLGVLIAFFSYLGLQNALIADFHPEVMALLPLCLAFYSWTKGKKTLFFLFLILGLTFKESLAIWAVFLGIFFIFKRQARLGLTTLFVGLFWLILTTRILIPQLSPTKNYFYQPQYPRQPLKIITNSVDEPEEKRTIFLSLASFLFLPALAPASWSLAWGDFLMRFGPEASVFGNKTLTMHYSALAALGLALASIQAYPLIKRFLPRAVPFVCLALVGLPPLIISRPILNGPLNLMINPDFFESVKNHRETEKFLNQVAPDATVMTHNSLAVRFSHQELFLLRPAYHCYQPHQIVINAEPGQNPNNFWELNFQDIQAIIQKLKTDADYELVYQQGEKYLFSRTSPRQGDFSRQAISNCLAEFTANQNAL